MSSQNNLTDESHRQSADGSVLREDGPLDYLQAGLRHWAAWARPGLLRSSPESEGPEGTLADRGSSPEGQATSNPQQSADFVSSHDACFSGKYHLPRPHSVRQALSVTVLEIVEEVLAELSSEIRAQGLTFSVEVQPQTVAVDRTWLVTAVRTLLAHSLAVTPRGGEVLITSYQNGVTCELEVADSGPDSAQGPWSPRLDHLRLTAQSAGGDLQVHRCPQGGTAYTLVLPVQAPIARKQARRAA